MLRARQTKQLSLTGSLDLDPYDFRNPGLQALSFLRLGLLSAPLPGRLDIKEGTQTFPLKESPRIYGFIDFGHMFKMMYVRAGFSSAAKRWSSKVLGLGHP